jgi:hypothetical protein
MAKVPAASFAEFAVIYVAVVADRKITPWLPLSHPLN